MTCIIHYKGLKDYDDLSPTTTQAAKTISLAKLLHESSANRDHDKQCSSIPPDGLTNHHYHKKPCYNKFTRIVRGQQQQTTNSKSTLNQVSSKPSIKTRSKQKCSTKFDELPTSSKKKVKIATRQSRRRGTAAVATSSSRNKFVFGKECVLCEKYELRYKDKEREEVREYPLLLTLDDPAQNIREQQEKKRNKYNKLLEKLVLVDDLISAEFKQYHHVYLDFTREDRDRVQDSRK